jgi:hypothetical protein
MQSAVICMRTGLVLFCAIKQTGLLNGLARNNSFAKGFYLLRNFLVDGTLLQN